MLERSRLLVAAVKKQARPAIILFLVFTLLCGIVYPLAVTGVAQIGFSHQANGSKIEQNGTVVGSELIGQPFSDPNYFWGRLSATPSFPYNASMSSGSNYGPNNPALADAAQARIDALHAADPNNTEPIPVDLVTSSGSGLDPDISVASALYQLPRVARDRNISESVVLSLIDNNTQDRQFGVLGEKTVNVLELNIALDDLGSGNGGIDNGSAAQATGSSGDGIVLGLRATDWGYLIIFSTVLLLLAYLAGKLFADAYDEEAETTTSRTLGRIESRLFRLTKVDTKGMSWKTYAISMVLFGSIGIVFLMLIMMFQNYLPLNPNNLGPVSPDLAFNTAVSFVTNTNWQSYAGETTMSYFVQMVGLTVQNFFSAATGVAVLIALIRGIHRKSAKDVGNFWVDMSRATIILLPLSFILAIILVSQGSVQTFDGSMVVQLVQSVTDSSGNVITTQIVPLGPVASQEAIKMLGTNGGGFFNTNSAHPFEDPTPLTNLLETIALLVIPVGLCFTFGRLVKDRRQGVAILIAMVLVFVVFVGFIVWAEQGGNPVLTNLGTSPAATNIQPGGNMEGKELRFGIVPSCLFAVSTTSTSCGAVNSMHDSYTSLGGMSPLLMIQFGEVIFGGVGSGLYGMLVFILIAVFVAGLMIGKMPDYLGKKIGPYEMKMSTIIILLPIIVVLIGTAIAVMIPDGRNAVLNPGPHGFTEILYAFSSAANNNGSAFAGLSTNSLFFNVSLAIAMIVGRFAIMVLTLALAGSLADKNIVPTSPSTLPTHTPLFIFWLVGVIVLIGALSYFLSLALGPIVEFLLYGG